MNIKTSAIIRISLTLALLVGVYKETGIFTTICMGLILVAFELQAIMNAKMAVQKSQTPHVDRLFKILEDAKQRNTDNNG